jgi:hypothetical protein
VEVHFLRAGGRYRARSIVLQDVTLQEARIGRILQLGARQIEHSIAREYAGEYRLVRPYRCCAGGLCSGEFAATGAPWHVTFGDTVGGAVRAS